MEKNVWEITASLYDTYVTRTKNKALREFLEIEEKLLDRVLLDLTSKRKSISLIEIGSGTGRTLVSYLTKRRILRRLTYLIGIDNAGAMYARAKDKFERLKASGIVSMRDLRKFIFLYMDALEMANFFQNGRINLSKVKATYGENSYLQNLKPRRYNHSYKVVINLLNTLGVMVEAIRPKVLSNMISAAGHGGTIVVSAFDASCFREIAPDIYGSIRRITGKFDETAFHNFKSEFKTKTYHSHWFSHTDLIRIIENSGAKIENEIPIEAALKGHFIVAKT